jgi:hypothetical protein
VIVGFELLAGMHRIVGKLQRWGAQRPLLLPEGRGTGPVPTEADGDIVPLPAQTFASVTEQVRGRMDPEALLTAEAREAVDTYDPDGTAWWWVSPVGPNSPVMGRRVLGGRPPDQIALEDKALVDGILADIPAPRSPSVLARATYEDLMRATDQVLDGGRVESVVWAGDASRGVNGGGDYVRWVRTPEQMSVFAEFFAARCDRVRITPFLEGVPCSIHGIVLTDGVAVFRPVEIVSLREMEAGLFVYAGLGTTWEPPPADTDQMRALARSIGEHLRDRHGYVGAYGIDGVLTSSGFRVTELNTRLSGGMTRLGRAAPDIQLELVQMNALLGRDIGMPSGEYEEFAWRRLDEARFVDVLSIVSTLETSDNVEIPVTAGANRLEAAEPQDPIVGTVLRGPSPMGTFLRLAIADGVLGMGDRAAPLAVLLREFANAEWDAGLPATLLPSDVRRGDGLV